MPPEDELCLLLARAELSLEARGRVLSLLGGPIEWPKLFERARRYGIFPLLYSGLRTLGFPGVPEPVRMEWTKTFNLNAIRNEFFSRELARILRLLGEAGIPVIPLKGTVLGESLYGDPALRVCADIDFLVPPRHAAEGFHALVSSGYRPEFNHPRLLDFAVRYGKHCVLTREEGPYAYTLELHFGLFWGGQLERELLEAIWSEADHKICYGVPAFALSAEWEFLYLAVHAAQHAWLSLMWYADLDRICRRGAIDWKKADEKAQWLGWSTAVRSSLAVCHWLFETPLDPACASAPPFRLGSADLCHGCGAGVPPAVAGASRWWEASPSDLQVPTENLFLLRLLKTPTRKLRYLAIRLLVPTRSEYNLLPLPNWLFFLYYPLRPLRVACGTVGWFVKTGWTKIRRLLL
jgi:Uncharacterised nucleotidyltransferase